MQLVLIRHAKSAYPLGVCDHDRPLNQRGVKDAAAVGRWLVATGLLVESSAVVVSSAKRALDSWALINGEQRVGGPQTQSRIESRLYEASQSEINEVISDTPPAAPVLIVIAHNPGLEEFASTIASNRDSKDYSQMTGKFPTSGVAVFAVAQWSILAGGGSTLTQFVVPRG